MLSFDFTQEAFDGVVAFDSPHPAEGWVDGVWHRRVRNELVTIHEPSSDGIAMRGSLLIEESDALDGDPNTIARDVLCLGTFIRVPLLACAWHLAVRLRGVGADQELALVVNGAPYATFTLDAHAERTIELDVSLTKREIEMGVVPASELDGGPDGAALPDAHAKLLALSLEEIAHRPAPAPRIFIAGDSTVQTYFEDERPQSGWGEWLGSYLHREGVSACAHDDASATSQARVFSGDGPTIYNRALGARGLRTYEMERRWERLLADVRPRDIVIIQFGLNDATKSRPQRYLSLEEYGTWLDRYVLGVLDRSAVPVLVTAPPQYHEEGTASARNTFDDYADAMRACARTHGVGCIDLRAQAAAYLDTLPPLNREAFYLRARPLQHASHPDGVRDAVHLSVFGARVCAGIIAGELARLFSWIEVHERPSSDGKVASVCNLTADVARQAVGLVTRLRWNASATADYFIIEKRNAHSGRVYDRMVALQTAYVDQTLPAQARCVRYSVTAWQGSACSHPATVSVALPSDDDACVRLE